MTIRFQAEIDDPQTEELMLWLKERYGDNWVCKSVLLRSALSWMELRAPHGCLNAAYPIMSLRVEPKAGAGAGEELELGICPDCGADGKKPNIPMAHRSGSGKLMPGHKETEARAPHGRLNAADLANTAVDEARAGTNPIDPLTLLPGEVKNAE